MRRGFAFLVSILLCLSAGADEIDRFTVPATSAGIRGDASLVFHGMAHPRNRSNYVTNAVFTDPGMPNNVIMVANDGDDTYDPVTRQEIDGFDNHAVLVGRSVDGGDTFYFRTVLRWTGGRRMVRVAVVPDPARHLVWAGIGQVHQNVPDSPAESFLGTTRIEIDWGTKKVRLLDQDLVGWDEYPFGTLNPPDPGFFTNKALSHIARVTVNGVVRFEAWGSVSAPQGSTSPCGSRTLNKTYLANIKKWAPQGKRIAWYRFDPATGVDLASERLITSSVRPLPTQYPRSDMIVTRAQFGGEDFLYVGTQDQIVCKELVQGNTGGASIRFVKLQYDPVAGNYDEVELGFLFDLTSATQPNWTCADPTVQCFGGTRNNYSLVAAVPHQNGSTIQIYAANWVFGAPSLPVVGEVGKVSAGHQPLLVGLRRSYREPVVFVQPPSYNEAQPAIARITGVNANSFTVQIQEDTGLDGGHTPETLHYVVLERGTYRLSDRRVLEVDKVFTNATIPATTSWTSSLDLTDSLGNDTGAVVFTQLQTSNDPYYAKTRHTGPPVITSVSRKNPLGQVGNVRLATASFGIENDQAALRQRQHLTETVGVLLIGERWLGRSSSIFTLGPWGAEGFDLRRTAGVGGITNTGWTSMTFEQPHLSGLPDPVLLAWLETRNGGDPAMVRYRNLSSSGVELAVDEDQSKDSERDHAGESVIYLVLGRGTGDIRAQPISPAADQRF